MFDFNLAELWSEETPIVGGSESVSKKPNTAAKVPKNAIVQKLIPDEISECALFVKNAPCTTENTIRELATKNGIVIGSDSPTQVMMKIKKKYNCDSERCVLEKAVGDLGQSKVKIELQTRFKHDGPLDDSLLSNINIDNIMLQWSCAFPKFFPYNFHMSNYASYQFRDGFITNKPDTLATINIDALYDGTLSLESLDAARGIKARQRASYPMGNTTSNSTNTSASNLVKCHQCGCIINTDKYQGPGKHWMALFVDTTKPVWTVEFFNSSGNNPQPEWMNWMEKTKNILERITARDKLPNTVKIIKASSLQHQWSRTECGLYSLFYIWARLNGVPADYFEHNTIPDQLMFEFRHHIFHNKKSTIKKFDWDKYQSEIKLEWE